MLPGTVWVVPWPALAPARAPGVPLTAPSCGVVWVVCGMREVPAAPCAQTGAAAGTAISAAAAAATIASNR